MINLIFFLLIENLWVEKSHVDFVDGWEYYYLSGDTATQWATSQLKKYKIGSYLYSPAQGGLRIIGRDWDLNDDGWLDVVLGRRGEGQADIYWNSTIGFDTTRKTILHGLHTYPQGFSIGDLDCNGYEDIIIAEYDNKVHIFYGDTNGYSLYSNDSIILGAGGAQHPLLTDINNDGYIDIIVSAQHRVYFYYGPGPFYTIPPDDSIICAGIWINRLNVSDLNYDKELDLTISNGTGVDIYWGPNFTSTINLSAGGNCDHSIADLNKDGYLDIFINQGANYDLIYWGSSSGFNSTSNVPGSGGGDCSVEDINNDGELDIAANQLSANAGYIIWGSDYTTFTLLPLSNSQMQVVDVADFDNNGEKDVLFGGAGGPACLYWNNGGFLPTNRFIFPDQSDDAVWEDLGTLWDRLNKERYLSNIFETGDTITVDSVKWWGNFPAGIVCSLWVRGALDTTAWSLWTLLTNGGTDTILAEKKFLQYRCVFSTDYKGTSRFSFDSIIFYYQYSGMSEDSVYSNMPIFCKNTPNPFLSKTIIQYILPGKTEMSLKIYNIFGQLVKILENGIKNAGYHYVMWDGSDFHGKKVTSGIYLYCLEAKDVRLIGKTILIK